MSCQSEIILELRGLCRTVTKKNKTKTIIDHLSYSFHSGLVYNIVGPSGAGKSSLLRLMNRLDSPTSGEIVFKSKPLEQYNPIDLRKQVNLMFQTPYLFEGSVLDNLHYCCPDKSIENPAQLMERVGLKPDFIDKPANDLSVGEKQRVAFARSLILNPKILLLDEPTSALDPSTSRKIEELILSLSSDLCLTIIIVTHNPDQALRLGGQTLLLVDGQLIETGDTAEILKNPQSELGRKYINRDLL